jgi:TM2 domain-containing membrane protein YozV
MRFARLRFVVAFGVAVITAAVASAAGSELGVGVAVCGGGLAWAWMLVDEVRGARAASVAFGTTARGFTRGQVARGIVLSWLIPGLGQIYAGERLAGMLTSIVFVSAWVVASLELVPMLVGLPVALALWVAGQVRVRRLVGVTWDPLIPSLGELFSRP